MCPGTIAVAVPLTVIVTAWLAGARTEAPVFVFSKPLLQGRK